MRLTLLAITLLYSSALFAQNWYEVEVLLFRQDFPDLASAGTVAETWPDAVDPAWPTPLVELAASDTGNRAMRALLANSRKLNNDAFAFRVTPGYELLWHQAWQQPMTNESEAPWIKIEGGEAFAGRYELEGGLRIHLARFLHLTGEFWLTDFGLSAGLEDPFSLADLPAPVEPLPACSHLRYQTPYVDPEAAPLAEDELELLERLPDWWKPPYACLLPREKLEFGAPLAVAPAPVAPTASVEVDYLLAGSDEIQTQTYLLPDLSISRPARTPMPIEEVVYSADQPVRSIVEVQMERRMRSGETHFIDHPRLGMLILVTPVPEPEPEPLPVDEIDEN